MTDSEKLDMILADMQNMKQEISAMKKKITLIDQIIEDELRVNIQCLAEAHYKLSGNLWNMAKLGGEAEVLSIKVRKLESDMRDLKPGVA